MVYSQKLVSAMTSGAFLQTKSPFWAVNLADAKNGADSESEKGKPKRGI